MENKIKIKLTSTVQADSHGLDRGGWGCQVSLLGLLAKIKV